MFDSATALGVGTVCDGICVACSTCGLSVEGKVAVTKSGVAVNALEISLLQLEQRIVIKIKSRIFL
jgi:hypothetical protein